LSGDYEPTSIVKLKEKLADPSVQKALKGFSKTVQFSLTDLKKDYFFRIDDGKLASLEKKKEANANIVVTIEDSLMVSIMNGTASPITEYMKGRLKIKGQIDDLLRLQKLMS